MPFTIAIEKRALKDVQKAIDYYDEQTIGLGKNFSPLWKNTSQPFQKILFTNFAIRITELYL